MINTNVAIIGAGPAGAVAGLTLARAGMTAILIEKSDNEQFRIGESLAPTARPLLSSLGLLARFLDDGHLPYYGNRSAWGRSELSYTDFIFSPFGHGWHLDRRRFNKMLFDAAITAGVKGYTSARLIHIERVSQGWNILFERHGENYQAKVEILLDCSGRNAMWAQRCGAKRLIFDNLIALVAVLETKSDQDPDTTTLIEAIPEGWWYTSTISKTNRIMAFHTDGDLINGSFAKSTAEWIKLLDNTQHMAQIFQAGHYSIKHPLKLITANSSRLNKVTGDGWLAAGDAAAAFDPISSQGIVTAIKTGLLAAKSVVAHHCGDNTALANYETEITRIYEDYLKKRIIYYSLERRWPSSPFWIRRSISSLLESTFH